MELKVAERLMLLNLLPKEGDLTTLRVVREAIHTIGLSDEELTALEIKHPVQAICQDCGFRVDAGEIPLVRCPKCGSDKVVQGEDPTRLIWKAEADVSKDITLGKKVTQIIRETFLKVSEEKKLTMAQVDLCDKFVSDDENE